MKTLNEYYKYQLDKYRSLSQQYGFTAMEINPCSINTVERLKYFIKKVMSDLFKQDSVNFVPKNEDDLLNVNSIKFLINERSISLSIDPRYNHIEIDFFNKLQLIADQFGKSIRLISFEPLYVVGDKTDMKQAWREGFPITIDEVDFLHKHCTGKRYTKEESRSKLVLNEVIDIDYFEEELLNALNIFLIDKGKTIQFTREQLIVYQNSNFNKAVSLNGYYCGGLIHNESQTIFDNSTLNQIFLIHYAKVKKLNTLFYRVKEKEDVEIKNSIQEFIDGLGKTNEN